ncbi:MAG TPA: hypothetical protein VJT31_26755 [Rugosimonospora sp.]|nr:hypothetical protein [Rugosimonospora sp.]
MTSARSPHISTPSLAGPVQLDLFGQVEADLTEQQARDRLHQTFQALKHRHPATGEDLGTRVWCGRCGAVEVNDFLIVINHELGWCAGCYARLRPGAVDGPFSHLSEAQRADRWDRQYFPDCANCGHPWGLHGWDIAGGSHDANSGCHALLSTWCRCPRYRSNAAALTGHQHTPAARAHQHAPEAAQRP